MYRVCMPLIYREYVNVHSMYAVMIKYKHLRDILCTLKRYERNTLQNYT